MSGLKELRTRIASVKATQKITRAMRMVAAAKLRRAQDRAVSSRAYASGMRDVLRRLSSASDVGSSSLLRGRRVEGAGTHLLAVCTSERGLCGGFNANLARTTREAISEVRGRGWTPKLFLIGSKGRDILRHVHGDLILESMEIPSDRDSFACSERIAGRLLSLFDSGEFDRCSLIFSRFRSVISQTPTRSCLIPPLEEDSEDSEASEGLDVSASSVRHDFEPSEDEILGSLLPRNVAVQIYVALLENSASEQGARMTAMDNATRSAGDMIDSLTLLYNRTRQAAITKELIEIISGAEAV